MVTGKRWKSVGETRVGDLTVTVTVIVTVQDAG